MGTRGLTAVFHEGRHRIAQYGQWDHNPSGRGLTALRFCRERLASPEGRAAFAARLAACRFSEKPDMHLASRDHGAKILYLVANSTGPLALYDEILFAGDSLFCEWAWVIDLDARRLEAFKGINKVELPVTARFAALRVNQVDENAGRRDRVAYQPVRLVTSWPLDALPTEEAFLARLGEGTSHGGIDDEEDEPRGELVFDAE